MLRKTIYSILASLFFVPTFLVASPVINTEDHPSALIEMKEMIPDHVSTASELKQLRKEENQLTRFEKRWIHINKILNSGNTKNSSGIFSDPVSKWFWIWVVTWGAGILLTVLLGGSVTGSTLGIIWLLAFALGSVALIIWLVKKFG